MTSHKPRLVDPIDHPGLGVNEYGIPAYVRIPIEDYEEIRSYIAMLSRRVKALEGELSEERSL